MTASFLLPHLSALALATSLLFLVSGNPPSDLLAPPATVFQTLGETPMDFEAGVRLSGALDAEAEVRFSGAVQAEGRGQAVWIYRPTPMGPSRFSLVIELESEGELHILEMARLRDGMPEVGPHRVIGIDDLPEPDEDFEANLPEGVLVSFQRGKWSSFRDLPSFDSDPEWDWEEYMARSTGVGSSNGGELRIRSVAGSGVSGSLEAQMTLSLPDGSERPFQVTVEFEATETTDP